MFVVWVHVHVKPAHTEAFAAASLANARNTVQEPGALRFDVLRQQDDPNRFVLYEAYKDADAAKAHKETAHYRTWRETVEGWMAEPRSSVTYDSLFPETEASWETRL